MAVVLQCTPGEAKEFGHRLLKMAPSTEDVAPKEEKLTQQDDKYTHANAYWHDPERDVYVIWLPHLPKPLALPAHMWAGIKAAYSQWQGAPASVEEIARKFGLTRRTVTALLRVMSHTHTGSPWTREHVAASEDETLVEDLILSREERVLRTAEAHQWNRVKAKAESWDRLQKGHLDALNQWLSVPASDRFQLPPSTTLSVRSPYMAVMGITDLHYGASGHDAAGALRYVLDRVEGRLKLRGYPQKILLPIGSDGLHYDTASYTTTRGTRMEADGLARDVVAGYMNLMASLIEELSAIAPVHCVPMAGNHDRMMSYATYAAMKLAFRGAGDRVMFSDSLSEVQVVTFGNSFVALNHGDRHKPESLMGILPRDFAPQWGNTKYRYCMLGHYHTSGTFGSKSGVECIYMPSLAPTDEWTEGQGFRSNPALSMYLFDAMNGLISTETIRGQEP